MGIDPSWEEDLWRKGYHPIVGVDEVGRGPLAGPIIAAAVVLPPFTRLTGVDDSKRLSPSKREKMFIEILSTAVAWSVAGVSARTIDAIGPHKASLKAIERAVRRLQILPQMVLIDGPWKPFWELPTQTIIKGDQLSLSIACASIIAKVTRDRLMTKLGSFYPQYGFENHFGYPTVEHKLAINSRGLTPHHRLSYSPIKNYLLKEAENYENQLEKRGEAI